MLKWLFHVAVEACHLGAIGSNELKQLFFFTWDLKICQILTWKLKKNASNITFPELSRTFLPASPKAQWIHCLAKQHAIAQCRWATWPLKWAKNLWLCKFLGVFTSFDFWNTPSSTKTSFQIDVALTLHVAECRWHPWDTWDKQLSFWIPQYTDSFPASKAWTAMFWSTCPGKDRWHILRKYFQAFQNLRVLWRHLLNKHWQTFASNLRKHTWSRHIQKLKPPGAKREKAEDFEDGNVESVECRKSGENDGTSSLDVDLDSRKMLGCGFWWKVRRTWQRTSGSTCCNFFISRDSMLRTSPKSWVYSNVRHWHDLRNSKYQQRRSWEEYRKERKV